MKKPKNKATEFRVELNMNKVDIGECAAALGRLGGLVKSERKTKAVTLNGLKGVAARKLKAQSTV